MNRGKDKAISCRARRGFTVFELLAVLMVIGIVTVMLVGAYSHWGTAHALTGSVHVITAGLEEARALAKEHRQIVAFSYGNTVTNNVKTVPLFQSVFCFPTNSTESIADVEKLLKGIGSEDAFAALADQIHFSPAAPEQKLPGSIRFRQVTISGTQATIRSEEGATLFFRPDGSAFSLDPQDADAHFLCVATKEGFPVAGSRKSEPLSRVIRIDLATGTTAEYVASRQEANGT